MLGINEQKVYEEASGLLLELRTSADAAPWLHSILILAGSKNRQQIILDLQALVTPSR